MATAPTPTASAAVPTDEQIERASEFAREPFLLEGQGPESLTPGSARRLALDAALAEIDAGASEPSIEWRRNFSLLLGLERLISEEPPTLRDGAELNPHQVDALSGTLAELIAEQEVSAGIPEVDLPPTDEPEDLVEEELEEDLEDLVEEDEVELEEVDAVEPAEEEEADDWVEEAAEEEEVIVEAAEDP
ncbi:MAG: hypothetical protein ACKORM_03130, partial [Solirubrobacterales bacterium]